MDTVQARRLPTDETLTVALVDEDFHLEMPDYEVSKYRNTRDEIAYRVDTNKYWNVSSKVKSKSFMKK
ncbi:MAG: hypothetical protein LUC90_11320 [Lachnospiraceae bacterium]|nr:hypothetical protein [Lachnospiraceae bacterium]